MFKPVTMMLSTLALLTACSKVNPIVPLNQARSINTKVSTVNQTTVAWPRKFRIMSIKMELFRTTNGPLERYSISGDSMPYDYGEGMEHKDYIQLDVLAGAYPISMRESLIIGGKKVEYSTTRDKLVSLLKGYEYYLSPGSEQATFVKRLKTVL
jgi:hypothetical protein